MDRPIPPFYCVYLLRSTVSHRTWYVGSTPNPRRRLRQHNGLSKGGAVRTARPKYRPWEMVCLVRGFPSNIAALQFEWAFQNPDVTRFISPEERITQCRTAERWTKKGRFMNRRIRPRFSLPERVSNLHLLLHSKGFARWPLAVHFYSTDVFQAWQKWCKKAFSQPPPSISVSLIVSEDGPRRAIEPASDQSAATKTSENLTGIDAIDVGYGELKAFLEKTTIRLGAPALSHCAICSRPLDPKNDLILLCPCDTCNMTSHLTCLSKQFLNAEQNLDLLVPIHGPCPLCTEDLTWKHLVQELTLRIRGEEEIRQLMKKPRKKTAEPSETDQAGSKGRVQPNAKVVADTDCDNMRTNTASGPLADQREDEEAEASEDDFVYRERPLCEDDSDNMSVVTVDSTISVEAAGAELPTLRLEDPPVQATNKLLPVVIPNSDWDDVDEIEE